MHFAQYYLDCLSQASYLIGDRTTGRAVLVDPRRDIDDYLHDAEAAGLRIELVIETHIHADFLSGHLELARATDATIAFGEAAETGFPIRRLKDGERISLGADDTEGVTLTVLATPGHTLESICLVVHENPDDDVPFGVLTGDTLFVGDVGRPDLLSAAGHSPEDMAAASASLPAHQTPGPPGRDPGLSRTRRRFGLRPQPLHRDQLHHRRPAPLQLRAPAHAGGRLRPPGHRGTARHPRVLRARRGPQPRRPPPPGPPPAAPPSPWTRHSRPATGRAPSSSTAARRPPTPARIWPVRSIRAWTPGSRSTPAAWSRRAPPSC